MGSDTRWDETARSLDAWRRDGRSGDGRLGHQPRRPPIGARMALGAVAAVVVAVAVVAVWRLAGPGAPRPRAGAHLVSLEATTSTTAWPTPGYSEEELRPVVDALVQLATGAVPGPVGPSPGPSPSSVPTTVAAPPVVPEGGTTRQASPPRSPFVPAGELVIVLLGALAAAGVAIRHRLRQQKRRGLLDSAPQAPVEPVAAGAACAPEPPPTPGIADRVDLALRHAWAAAGDERRPELASVLAVRVGDLGVEVLLDPGVPDAPGRFVASDAGHEWRLGAEVPAEELRRGIGNQPAPLPALITVGGTDEGPVLVDLGRIGTLSVEGDEALVGAFLAGVALELASAPWAAEARVGLVGGDGRLGALANVDLLAHRNSADDAAAGEALSALGRRVGDWLQPSSAMAVVVVARGAASHEATAAIAAAIGAASSPCALVGPGPIPAATWRLVVGADGTAVLHPLGLELACAVDAAAVADAVGSLSATVSARPDPTEPAGPGDPAPDGPGALVLGPVVVRWPKAGTGRRPTRRKLDEVVAYLATHPERPVPAERIRTAIWPLAEDERAGEVADSTFRATMSRTRSALGTDAHGQPYLPDAREGSYSLDPAFGCDWADFTTLVRRARTAPDEAAIELFRQALSLVRGAPFADAPRGAYGWAWSEQLVSAIEVAVADVAERLAELALAAGDHATARWAATKGLLVVPTREGLYRARMRAAFEAGDVDDMEQAYTEVRRAARALDAAEEPQAETTALYERLRRAARPGTDHVPADDPRRLTTVP